MRTPDRRRFVSFVHAAIIAVRLSYESFFVALTTYLAYLFRWPGPLLAALVRAASALSWLCQLAILYVFPLVCWFYNAGFVFSLFITVMFWGLPVYLFVEGVAERIVVVAPEQLFKPRKAAFERMGGQCPICWSALPDAPDSQDEDAADAGTSGADTATASAAAGQTAGTVSSAEADAAGDGSGSAAQPGGVHFEQPTETPLGPLFGGFSTGAAAASAGRDGADTQHTGLDTAAAPRHIFRPRPARQPTAAGVGRATCTCRTAVCHK